VALVGFVGAGFGLLANQEWWPTLAVASAVISIIAVGPWANTMPLGSFVDAIIVDVVVLLALLLPWKNQVIEALR
jgi:hypothetical protein